MKDSLLYNVLVTFIKKHPLFIFIILGLLLRLFMIFYDYGFDVNNHIVWAEDLWRRGFSGFYETRSSMAFGTDYPNYPPFAQLIFYLVYPLQVISHAIIWWFNISFPPFPSNLIFFIETKTFLAGMFKLPGIFTDIGIAYVVYLYAKRIAPKDKSVRLIASSLVLFNPAFFFTSALWGQIDSIPILFVLISFYFALFSEWYLVSGILFLLSFLVKPTTLVFLPIYAIFFLVKFKFQKTIKTLIVTLVIFWVAFFPFFKLGNILTYPFVTYIDAILAKQSLLFVTNGAFNFWVLITQLRGIKDTVPFLFSISYRMWGIIFTSILYIILIYRFVKKEANPKKFFQVSLLTAFTAFIFLTKMHERYLMLPLSMLLLLYIVEKKYLVFFLLLSVLSFLNLYHSWAVPKIEPFIKLIQSPELTMSVSLINTSLLVYLLFRQNEGNDHIRRHENVSKKRAF